jgi:hypothetical protein
MRGLAISTVILLIIGLIVLVIAITMLVRGQSAVGVSLGQADLRNCCINYCSRSSGAGASSIGCSVPKQTDTDKTFTGTNEPDGKMRLSEIINKVGFDYSKMGELCNC